MKIAILGSGAESHKAVSYFKDLGASVHQIDEGIKRVQKRFLALGETPGENSRLSDLFRVVFERKADLKNYTDELKEKAPEIANSLNKPIEDFIDVDIVVDAREERYVPHFCSSSHAPALNELSLKESGLISYDEVDFDSQDYKKLTIIGDNIEAARTVLSLKDWLFDKKNSLQFITKSERPFANLTDLPLYSELDELLSKLQEDFQRECDVYQSSLHEWRTLSIDERTKLPEPEVPTQKVTFWTNFSVTSLDKLDDREGLFLTIESREDDTLKTLATDKLIVLNGRHYDDSVARFLNLSFDENRSFDAEGTYESEPGFFVLDDIEKIKNEILRYFTRTQ